MVYDKRFKAFNCNNCIPRRILLHCTGTDKYVTHKCVLLGIPNEYLLDIKVCKCGHT